MPRPGRIRRHLAALDRAHAEIRELSARNLELVAQLESQDRIVKNQADDLRGLEAVVDDLRKELGQACASNVQLAHRTEQAELLLQQASGAHEQALRIHLERQRVQKARFERLAEALEAARTRLRGDPAAADFARELGQLLATVRS